MEHDLLSEDDFFEQLKKEKRQTDKAEEKRQEAPNEEPAPEESMETDLFEIEKEEAGAVDEEPEPVTPTLEDEEESIQAEVGEEPPIEPHPFEEESFASYEEDMLEPEAPSEEAFEKSEQSFEAEEIQAQPEEPKPKIYVPEDKIEDEKLPGLSKKPVIIWSIVAIALLVGIFVVFYLFFGNKGEQQIQPAEKVREAPQVSETPAENPILTKQKAFLGQVSANNGQILATIGNIFNNAQKNNTQIASMLLYGNELSVEILGKNRDQLAKALMGIKASLNNVPLKVVASDVRPGDGITNVISFKLPTNAGSGEINAKLTSVNEAVQWLKMMAGQFSVTISSVKELASKPAQFNLNQHKIQFKIKGHYDNCVRFLGALGQSNRNLQLYKMVFSSLDQKSFSKTKYQADIIAELYF